mmetsp:Transcript_111507/g.315715  ORF Transcript_111507/g.315715 Transcript_111507/m.315715 type:complete len:253 (+) Transcript_111507:679-1437(+)
MGLQQLVPAAAGGREGGLRLPERPVPRQQAELPHAGAALQARRADFRPHTDDARLAQLARVPQGVERRRPERRRRRHVDGLRRLLPGRLLVLPGGPGLLPVRLRVVGHGHGRLAGEEDLQALHYQRGRVNNAGEGLRPHAGRARPHDQAGGGARVVRGHRRGRQRRRVPQGVPAVQGAEGEEALRQVRHGRVADRGRDGDARDPPEPQRGDHGRGGGGLVQLRGPGRERRGVVRRIPGEPPAQAAPGFRGVP